MKRTVFMVIVLAVVFVVLFGVTGRAIHAQGSGASDSTVSVKLDAVLINQKSIMKDLADIKEELRIIKIRITQQQ